MMPALLLQILLTPLLASVVVFLARNHIGRFAGWVTSGALVYTTSLVMVAAVSVIRGQIIIEEYRVIAPNTQNPDAIRLGLLADGLSVSTLAVVLLLCTALALYSIRYIEHRIEILYVDEDQVGQDRHYVRFFYLLPLFPVGFIGTILSSLRPDWELGHLPTGPDGRHAVRNRHYLSVSCRPHDETGHCAISRLDAFGSRGTSHLHRGPSRRLRESGYLCPNPRCGTSAWK